jgi:hypothetical protein
LVYRGVVAGSHRALLGVVAILVLAPISVARADIRDECASASEGAQKLHAQGKLVESRARLLECVRPACPAAVKGDCERMLSEVDAALPSIAVTAKGPDGADAVAVRVFVDGTLFRDRLDGLSIPLDPGEHDLRFELAGARPAAMHVLVAEAQKNRPIAIAFEALAPASPAPPTPGPATGDVVPPASTGRAPASPLAYVLATLGGAGLAAFAFFQTRAVIHSNDLRSTCAPRCPQSDVNDVSDDVVAAHVTLAVGVVSVAAATTLFLVAPWPSSRAAAFVGPRGVGLRAEF